MKRSQGQWWIDNNYPPAMISAPALLSVDSQYNIIFNDLLSDVMQIIKFEGMPESVDITYFKMCLYLAGRVAVFRDTRGSGEVRALDCATAGEPDIYYMPRQILIVNPAFDGYSYTLTPGEDCAVIFCRECDRYQYGRQTGGLYGLISSTAQQVADINVSINVAVKNIRLTNIIAAENEITVASIDETIKRMYNGAPYVAVMKSMIDKMESFPITAQTNTQQLIQLIQTRQYIYSHFYEMIGLKTHDQMKKERLITAEIDEGTETAVFNLDDMLEEIQRGIDEANKLFDLEITMQLNPLIARTLEPAADPEQEAPAEPSAAAPAAADAAPDPDPQPDPEPEPAAAAAADDTQSDTQTDGSGAPDAEPEEMSAEPTETAAPEQEIKIEIEENYGEITIEVAAPAEDPAEEPDEEPPPEGGAEDAV